MSQHFQSLKGLCIYVKVQHQFKSAQAQALTRQTMIQQIQRELQQAKDQNLTKNKELQQATQEVNNVRSALTQAENKVKKNNFTLFPLLLIYFLGIFLVNPQVLFIFTGDWASGAAGQCSEG